MDDLLNYLTAAHDPICPSCAQRRVDPKSPNGWCPKCDGRRERTLASKRKWWDNNRGANAPKESA